MVVKHVIVDGSNIATEGREAPSLAQLDEAVRTFVAEYEPDVVTVVVDATFPNRIDPSERQTYEDAVIANELITPPAGAVGRGDGFVLQIADKAGAAILSNDSFQEFHGRYPWLFERGRLIGGKPVPHVGWVFMERAPVRGPTSRRAVSEARKEARQAEKAVGGDADTAGAAARKGATRKAPARKSRAAKGVASAPEPAPAPAPAPAETSLAGPQEDGAVAETYNDALPFIEFVGAHPVGSEVEATVERFSSHGAYALAGEVRAYVPLRHLGDPTPRSAREVLSVGESRTFVVVAVDPARRGVDLGLPGVVEIPAAPPGAAGASEPLEPAPPEGQEAARPKRRSRKAAAEAGEPAGPEPAGDAPAGEAERPAAKKAAARKLAAKKAAARKTAAKRPAAKKAPAGEGPPEPPDEGPTQATPAGAAGNPTSEKAAARKRGARKAPADQPADTAAEEGTAGAGPAGEAPAREAGKPAAKKAATRKRAAKKAPAREVAGEEAGAEKPAAKRTATRRSTGRKSRVGEAGTPKAATGDGDGDG